MFYFFDPNLSSYSFDCDNLSDCTNSFCASFDKNWNLICTSGTCGSIDGYNVPPPYYRNYVPCCFEYKIQGSNVSTDPASGICLNTCNVDRTYYSPHAGLHVYTLSGVQYIRAGYGFGWNKGGGCFGRPWQSGYWTYEGWAELGTYDPNCKFDCRNLAYTIGGFTKLSGMQSVCDFSNVTVSVSSVSDRSKCFCGFGPLDGGWDLTPCVGSASGFSLPSGNCFTTNYIASGIIDSYTYVNKCGQTKTIDYETMNSGYLHFCLSNISVSGVVGLDDGVPDASATILTCKKCGNINGSWTPISKQFVGWHGITPPGQNINFDTCCDCSEQMCLKSWHVLLGHPSSYIYLAGDHGTAATWSVSTPSGVCPSNPTHFAFESQSNDDWNRCNFSGSAIDASYTFNLGDFLLSSSLCTDRSSSGPELPHFCTSCLDLEGPDDLLVTINVINTAYVSYDCYWTVDEFDGDYVVSKSRRYGGVLGVPPSSQICNINPCLSGTYDCPCKWTYNAVCIEPTGTCFKIYDPDGCSPIGCCHGTLLVTIAPGDATNNSGTVSMSFDTGDCWKGYGGTLPSEFLGSAKIPGVVVSGADACGNSVFSYYVDCNNIDVTINIPSGTYLHGGTARVRNV